MFEGIRIKNIREASEISNFSESLFATHFFQSILPTLGFKIQHEPGRFYAKKTFGKYKGRKEITVPDFVIWNQDRRLYPCDVLTEVTESEHLKNKTKQRRVMVANSNDRLAYIQLPWDALMNPEWCFGLILQMAEGKIDTEKALSIVSNALFNDQFETINAQPLEGPRIFQKQSLGLINHSIL